MDLQRPDGQSRALSEGEFPSPASTPQDLIPIARPLSGPIGYARPAGSGSSGGGSGWPNRPVGWRRRWWAPRPISRLQALGDLLIVAGTFLAPQVAAGLLGARLRDVAEAESVSPMRLLTANSLIVGMIAILAVYLTWRSGQPLSSIGLRRVRFWPAIRSALAALFTMYAALLALALLAMIIVRPSPQTVTEPMRQIQSLLGTPSWRMIALMAGSAAVFEEILFRGFLLTRLRVLLGNWTAAIIVGMVLFAVLHVWEGTWAIVLILPVGLVLSITFVRRRSLASPMLAHFLFNFFQMAMMRALESSPYLREHMS